METIAPELLENFASQDDMIAASAVYRTNWDHLADELRRLDFLIYHQVILQRSRQPSNPLEQFKGLVLSEEEIDVLLSKDAGPSDEKLSNPDDSQISKLRASTYELATQIRERRAASLRYGINLALPHLAQIFHLTAFEENCLLVCLAPELDRKYEKLYAYLQDDVTRKKPSVDLVLGLFCQSADEKRAMRTAFDPAARLLKYRLLHATDNSPDAPSPLLARFLKLDDRVVNFLLGFGQMDSRLEPVARLVSTKGQQDAVTGVEEKQSQLRRFARALFSETALGRQNAVFYFYGPYGAGKQSLAEAVCRDLALPLIVGDAGRMLAGPSPFEEIVWLFGRESVLQPAALCLENVDCLLADDDKHQQQLKSLLGVTRTFSRLTFLLGSRAWKPQGILNDDVFIALEFPVPDDHTRKCLWENCLNGRQCFAPDVDLGALASKFRFTPGQVNDALAAAQNLARWRSPGDGQLTMADLYAACRAQSNHKLSALAVKVQPKYTWSDLVLPREQMGQLREMVNHVKYRQVVYGEWGFARKMSSGKGLNLLFSGPSGTGKTMAAEVIANELGLDLYKIDLSQVVSKYIGETEKNLDRIFREAQTSNAILFFDEADALFGKRSEVKDAHDRYANIEVGYLLQKMEEYEGVAILATNLRGNLDEAFARRMHFAVEFPFPDEEYRCRIWSCIFPTEAPLANDVDFATLARSFKLSGGNIKNIAVAAAFLAAEAGQAISRKHLWLAAKREFQKVGQAWDDAQWRRQGVSVT